MLRATALLALLLLGSVLHAARADCTTYSDCKTCASSTYFGLSCNWCPLNGACYNTGSFSNPCHFYEDIDNPSLCGCNSSCTASGGAPASVCNWYTAASSSLPPDPAQWQGGDFLPSGYGQALQCLCNGGGEALWNSSTAACVRLHLYKGHQQLTDEVKQALRNVSMSVSTLNCPDNIDCVSILYGLQVQAYQACCCSGTPAPEAQWALLFWAGRIIVCPLIVGSVLEYGRCGCGW